MKNKLLIIDGNSLANRAYYALPYLTNKKGQFTGAVFGFVNMLIKILSEEKPTHLLVTFDFGRKTFRNEIYAEYKAHRKPTPPELKESLKLLKETLDKMNITRVEQEGIEADDIIGTLSKNTNLFDGKVLILSGDRDVLQLVDERVDVMLTKKGISETQLVTHQNIEELYELSASQIIDLKALMGDASDNIPGIAGVGEKTALKLLKDFGTVENVVANIESQKGALKEKLESGKELALVSKQLATINTNANFAEIDFNNLVVNFPFDEKVYALFEELEFNSLLKKAEYFDFDKSQIASQKPEEVKIVVKTAEDLKRHVSNAQKTKVLAFDILKTNTFAFDEGTVIVLDNEHTLFNQAISTQEIVNAIKHVLEDESVLKISSDLKAHMHLFDKYSVEIKGKVFDTEIAEYLLFAGIKRKPQEAQANILIETFTSQTNQLKEMQLVDLFEKVEIPLVFVLFEMEKSGFKIDDNALNQIGDSLKEELDELTKQIHLQAGEEFNINSPKQLGQILFEKLELFAYGNKKNSTGIEILNQLYDKHAIIPLIVRYRKLFKLSSTYVESYKQIVKESGNIIHTVFNQTTASTGRLSSTEPNLQNLPIKDQEGKKLRKLFVSKFENGQIVSADYNQIELRLLADFSQDKNMLAAYNNGKDIHSTTASQIFDVPLEEVTPSMRSEAKAVNFGIVYGISDYGLSTSIQSTKKQAKEYIDKYFETYSGVKQYLDNQVASTKKTGLVRTMFGRIRRVPEINSAKFVERQFGERVAMNMPLQGTASDIIKLAMISVSKKLKEQNLKSQLILQIHDELLVDAAEAEVEAVKKLLKQEMENVAKLSVKLVVDVSHGKTWFDT